MTIADKTVKSNAQKVDYSNLASHIVKLSLSATMQIICTLTCTKQMHKSTQSVHASLFSETCNIHALNAVNYCIWGKNPSNNAALI